MCTLPFALLLLTLAAILTGCPAPDGSGSSTQEAGSPESTATAPAEPAAAATAADSTAPEQGEVPEGEGFSAPDLDPAWQVANITLGISITEARQRLPLHDCIPIEENWASENYTGVLLAGTYEDPVGRVLSIVCFEDQVVGVVDSLRETEGDFATRFKQLEGKYGYSRGDTPEFAQGRQFIFEMVNADPAPDFQYMWADDDTQSMFFAAHFKESYISNYVLIDAARYDYAAAAMAAAAASKEDSEV